MRAAVDADKCQGHLRCVLYAEEVFDVDDLGHAVARPESIPAHLEESAQRAAANCPEGAISITTE